MIKFITNVPALACPALMGLDIIACQSAVAGSTPYMNDSPAARRWRAKTAAAGGFRRDIYDSNDQAIPMPVKMATLGLRVTEVETPDDSIPLGTKWVQDIGWKVVSVADDVPSSDAVEIRINPIAPAIAEDVLPTDAVVEVRGAQLTLQATDAVGALVAGTVFLAAHTDAGGPTNTSARAQIDVIAPGNSVLIASVLQTVSGGSLSIPIITGLGVTWTLLATIKPGYGSGVRLTAWVASVPTPVSGLVTIEMVNASRQWIASVIPFTGDIDLDNPVAQIIADPLVRNISNGNPMTTQAFPNPLAERSGIVSILAGSPSTGTNPSPDANYRSLAAQFSSFILDFISYNVAYRPYNDQPRTTWSYGFNFNTLGCIQIEIRTRGIADAATGIVPDSYEVYENAAPNEAVQLQIGPNPSVFDNSAPDNPEVLTEFVQIAVPPQPSVSDTITETESVTIQMNPLQRSVSDADTPSEAVTIQMNPLDVDVHDTTVVGESVSTNKTPTAYEIVDERQVEEFVLVVVGGAAGLGVVVSDDDGASEAISLNFSQPILIAVSDDEVASDVVVGLEYRTAITIDVYDDDTFPPLEPPPMPATGIARDYVEVTEGLAMGLGLPVLGEDDITVDEAVAIGLGIAVRVSDDIPAVDFVDATQITINPVLLGFDGGVADPASPAELVTVALSMRVTVTDDELTADSVVVAPVLTIVVVDDTPADDVIEARSPVGVRAADDVPSTDFIDALLSVLLLEVADDVPNEDALLATVPLGIRVQDTCEGGPDVAIGERRFVTTVDLEDLHLINDAGVAAGSTTGARVTRKS